MDHRDSIDGFNYDVNQYHDSTTSDPPQIFASYGPDGHPIPPTFPPGPYFAPDLSDLADGGDENDPKRRRIARACDMCRKKKIKCDGKLPKCGHCTNYKTECIFTHVEKKRNPPKGAKYIEGLENRLGRMEQLLKISGLITDEEAGRSDLGAIERRLAEKTRASSNRTSPKPSIDTPNSTQRNNDSHGGSPNPINISPRDSVPSPIPADRDKSQDVESISDAMCSLVTNGAGETRYIGSSSALSIFSQKGIEWVNQKTGDTSFQETIQNAIAEEDQQVRWLFFKPDIFGDLFMKRVFKPLPPKEECISLLKDY